MNRFDQFVTEIEGLEIHFIHERSSNPTGCHSSSPTVGPARSSRFGKVIGPLTDPTAHGGRASDAFHVVCASLPGSGHSGVHD